MSIENPITNPEQAAIPTDDNARKFVLAGLPAEFLEQRKAVAFTLVSDWLEKSNHHEKKLVEQSILRITKERYEFGYEQNGMPFSLKYDEFEGGKVHVLEVEAAGDNHRDDFDDHDQAFPAELEEVTGIIEYYGHRIESVIKAA